MTGTIARKNEEKGYAFISVKGQKRDTFMHMSGLANCEFEDLKVGDTVSFEVEQAEKGPKAVRIMLMD